MKMIEIISARGRETYVTDLKPLEMRLFPSRKRMVWIIEEKTFLIATPTFVRIYTSEYSFMGQLLYSGDKLTIKKDGSCVITRSVRGYMGEMRSIFYGFLQDKIQVRRMRKRNMKQKFGTIVPTKPAASFIDI